MEEVLEVAAAVDEVTLAGEVVVVAVLIASCRVLAQPPIPNTNNQDTITRQIMITNDQNQIFGFFKVN